MRIEDVISVKTFNNSEEFEQWQINEDFPNIINVVAMPNAISGSASQDGTFGGSVNLTIVVTYWKEVKVEY